MFKFEELVEIRRKGLAEVIEWLYAHNKCNFECIHECEYDYTIYIGGYWSDDCIVIELEDGVAVRWYRQGAWD